MGNSPTADLLDTFSGGGGGSRTDWLKIKNEQKAVRLYRHDKVAADGTKYKELAFVRVIHWVNQKPYDCTGPGCEYCKTVARLEASGVEEDAGKAKKMRANPSPTFSVVDVANPQKFQLFDANWSTSRELFLNTARAGGWTEVYPDGAPFFKLPKEEQAKKKADFKTAFTAGLDKVCGPNGRDFLITHSEGKGNKTWDVFMRTDGNKVLPFLEDENVPNPEEVRRQIAQRMSEKEGDQ